jgi:hypothetical protein
MEKMEFHRKDWNQRHAAIRRILMKEKDYRKALPLLLKHHAAVHSSKLGARWSFQDEVLGALTEDQMRIAPKGGQSAVWKLWHATRVEDVTMNVLLAGSKQVLTSGGWLKKLGVKVTDVGKRKKPFGRKPNGCSNSGAGTRARTCCSCPPRVTRSCTSTRSGG